MFYGEKKPEIIGAQQLIPERVRTDTVRAALDVISVHAMPNTEPDTAMAIAIAPKAETVGSGGTAAADFAVSATETRQLFPNLGVSADAA